MKTERKTSLALVCAALLGACGGGTPATPSGTSGEASSHTATRSASCPAQAPAPDPLPGTTAAHRTLAYWLEREGVDLDRELLTPEQIDAHNLALSAHAEGGLGTSRRSLAAPPPLDRLTRTVRERLAYMSEKLERGEYVDATGSPLAPPARGAFSSEHAIELAPELRVALGPVPIRCGPRAESLYKLPIDTAFDRNNCSTARPQEPVQILARWPNGMRLARTRYSIGWITDDAALSAPLAGDDLARVLEAAPARAPSGATLRAEDGATLTLAQDALLPSPEEDVVLFADAAGLHRAPMRAPLASARRPLTRRALLEEAFRRMGQPYGWGDHEGGLDCSRFVMDVLSSFGLELPRGSAQQASAGTYTIDVSDVEDLEERQRLIDEAARVGVVLLHFPGHIMLYLGRDAAGTPMAAHSFSEYVEPCEGEEAETIRRVDRVSVSDLSLGAGSSRGAFLERIDELVVLGQQIGPGLIGVAQPRSAAAVVVPEPRACEDGLDVRVFRSPERPNPRQPLRVFVTATEELGPVELALIDPEGRRVATETRRLGGPPFTYWAEIDRPAAGRWTVVLGDGPDVAACEHVTVAAYPGRPEPVHPERVWEPRFRWEADTEALFAAFVEQLFNFPLDDERTWPNLSVLLEDPAQNLLHNHFGLDEEEALPLQPDCADLPYFLRTYFAWKLRLPFGFRSCTRGRHGRLPACDEELRTPAWVHEQVDPVQAFRSFILTQVKRGVHSASGRTHPEDEVTPLYPVPLTREALRPGTVFADPYGHLLVIAQWIPQGADDYGVLVGAEAQPDGTIGRRQFWRGSFLFHPDTTMVGAGFKAWRPVVYDRREQAYTTVPNAEITERNGYVPFSMQQYGGATEDFYEAMEGLINPRALDPVAAQLVLIDAFEESVTRRVVSVNNGEEWLAANPGSTIEMPSGGAIFQTGGPWENFSTPSRDMRLLIAMDTVLGFPDVMRRNPARFGLTADTLDEAIERVLARQRDELRRRTFQYTRSDGRAHSLSLAEVIERAAGFEMSYNPNDCVEIRWAAPERSDEMRACHRHAPAEQRARMSEYREWFATRQRPIY